jgi:hypothetical protein
LPPLPADLPDTGTLRGDVLALLTPMAQRLQELGAETIHGLMAEYLAEYLGKLPISAYLEAQQSITKKMMPILERAAERGEADLDKITPRIATLPMDLVRGEVLLTHAPVSEATIREIVDDIFLPLVQV